MDRTFQILFTDTSSAEIAALPKLLQIQILGEIQALKSDPKNPDPDKFGELRREGTTLRRFRATDYRIYFNDCPEGVRILRVLHRNSLKDFLFRSNLPMPDEDAALQDNSSFWKWIDGDKKT
jgi:mRNA-degrading endonuclease RelE of RelBE toxin-antitoxin system